MKKERGTQHLPPRPRKAKILTRRIKMYRKFPCPNNVQALRVPKVNPVIWDSILPKARSRDLKLQQVQKPLVKGITALAKTVP